MKRRNGFVTNSSSSSFVLNFKNEADYNEFKEYCNDYDFESVFDLVDNCRNNVEPDEDAKEKAFEILYSYYGFDYMRKILNEKFGCVDDWSNRIKLENEWKKTEEFKKLMDDYLNTTEYPEKMKKLMDSEIIVTGMIWDTNGGLLEWAIRNEFLETEFRQWTNTVLNIG